VVTIDRPPVNAMNVELLAELGAALEALAADPPAAVVLAGREGCFSAGADLKAVPGYGPREHELMVRGINRMAIAAYGLGCPAVAALTGHAIAGGMVLALCFDYLVASSAGRYGLTEIKVGVPYPQAAIALVAAELTPAARRRLALRSRLTDAAECHALGVVDEVLEPGAVLGRAVELAGELAAMPADVYTATKRDLRRGPLAEMIAGAAREPLLASR
jgi:enoyl-CoA hydratase